MGAKTRRKPRAIKNLSFHRGVVPDDGIGHWINNSGGPVDTRNFGFTYVITNLVDGRKYIGKKQYFSYSRGKLSAQSNWRLYTGSNKALNQDIKTLGKDNFKFEIIGQYKTRSMLNYKECNQQHREDCLLKTDQYYNRQILACKGPPVEEYKK